MKQIVILSELQGQVIKDAFEDDQLIVVFKDNSFAIFHTYEHSDSVYLSDDKMDLKPNRYNFQRLFDMGIISEKEKEAIVKQQQEVSISLNQKREIEQLLSLKAKYPNI